MKALLKDTRLFLTLLIISVLLMFFDSFSIFYPVKSVIQVVATPIQVGLYTTNLKMARQLEFIKSARNASQEKKALQSQLALVLSENAHLRRKLSEVQTFVAQQEALNPQTFNLLPARVIGFSRYLKIDKGSDDGLKINQGVVIKDNLVGQIKAVGSKQSEVMLISDPDSKIVAIAYKDGGKAKGILNGQFGAEMLLDKVLHQEPLKKEDLIYTDGAEGKFPRGLILGQVLEIEEQETQLFKQAKVKPLFNISDLDIVFVIRD